MAKYRIDKTEPRNDGSGKIAWDIWALDDDELVIPGKHATVLTPYDETNDALDSPKPGVELRKLLIKYKPDGWDNTSLDEDDAANKNAQIVDGDLNAYVESKLGGFPVTFNA